MTTIKKLAAASLLATAGAAYAQPVAAELILLEGRDFGGATIDNLGQPVVNGLNQVGVFVSFDNDTHGVWLGDDFIFRSTEVDDFALTGGEANIGVGNNGEFVYSPSVDGDDAVWGEGGLIAREDTQAPDFPSGINSTFHSRPSMTTNGAAYWVSGINDGFGGTSTTARQIYRQDPTTGAIETVIRAGDTFGGRQVAGFGGLDFDFAIAPDESSSIFVFSDANSPSTSDGTLVVNGSVIATEGTPSGGGDNWDNFDRVDANSLGNYVFSGDTDGSVATDEFIAYNGEIKLRQGDVIDGRTLDTSVDTLALNDLNQLAWIWNTDLDETLFFAADAADPASSVALLSVGDKIDTDKDGVADFTVTDFNAFDSEDLGFGDDGLIYVNVDVEDADGSTNEAIISVVIPAPGAAALLAAGGLLGLRRRR